MALPHDILSEVIFRHATQFSLDVATCVTWRIKTTVKALTGPYASPGRDIESARAVHVMKIRVPGIAILRPSWDIRNRK